MKSVSARTGAGGRVEPVLEATLGLRPELVPPLELPGGASIACAGDCVRPCGWNGADVDPAACDTELGSTGLGDCW